ncbi:Uncharacterised protein [Yersinia nurmii]|uniref:Uncharacterized protein n=1 Tax=Yersinia nurmii TaxID=685706 RepID=A0ABP1YE77_9GAMM|nr:Uncharacterised protein [Yersinia nurmii]
MGYMVSFNANPVNESEESHSTQEVHLTHSETEALKDDE